MSIQEHLNKIRNAIYGHEVRESIAKGIETAYDDASEKDNANMEVKIARGTHPNLRSRLEEVDNKQQQTTAQLAQKASKAELNNLGKLKLAGEHSTLTDLQNAYPTGAEGMHLVIADGFLYRWSGAEWIQSVQFQSTGIGDGTVTATKTDFVKLKDLEPKDIYEVIPFSTYHNPGNDGFAITNRGALIESQYTTTLTVTNNVDLAPAKYRARFRALAMFDSTGADLQEQYIDNSGYNEIEFTVPPEAETIIFSLQISDIETATIKRVSVIDADKRIAIPRLDVDTEQVSFLKKNGSQYEFDELLVHADNTSFAQFVPDETRNYQEIVYSEIPHTKGAMWNIGVLTENEHTSELNATAKIVAYPNQTYSGRFRNVNFTDENDVYISTIVNDTVTPSGRNPVIEFVTPPNVRYIKLTIRTNDLDSQLNRITPLPSERMFTIPNLLTTNTKRFEDKKMVIFGDSYLDEISRPQIANVLSNRLDMDVVNVAIGGAKMANRINWTVTPGGGNTALSGFRVTNAIVSGDYSDQEEYVNSEQYGNAHRRSKLNLIQTTNFNEIDFGLVSYGVNDFLQGIPIGTINDDTGDTFIGAYKIFLTNMLTNYPNVKWVLVTPTFMTGTHSHATNDLIDYVNAIQLVGDYFNLPVCNNYHNAGINSLNRLNFFSDSDDVHPNDFGLNHLGNRIANKLEMSY